MNRGTFLTITGIVVGLAFVCAMCFLVAPSLGLAVIGEPVFYCGQFDMFETYNTATTRGTFVTTVIKLKGYPDTRFELDGTAGPFDRNMTIYIEARIYPWQEKDSTPWVNIDTINIVDSGFCEE